MPELQVIVSGIHSFFFFNCKCTYLEPSPPRAIGFASLLEWSMSHVAGRRWKQDYHLRGCWRKVFHYRLAQLVLHTTIYYLPG